MWTFQFPNLCIVFYLLSQKPILITLLQMTQEFYYYYAFYEEVRRNLYSEIGTYS